jgi:uncharacterized protein YbjT (DUF2867 family)
MSDAVLVIGATGQQGGAVARHLRANGLPVRVLVRSPGQPQAISALSALGCEIVRGDLNDPDSVITAMEGCATVFAATTPYADGVETEIRHGKLIVDAAAVAGAHLVYSGAATAGVATGVPELDSKLQIEDHLRRSGAAFTILGPTFFMENFVSPGWLPALKYGALAMALPEGIPLQLIALDDLGEFAAIVCESPDAFAGARIGLAGDDLDGPGMAAALSAGIGVDITFAEVPLESIASYNPAFARLFAWYGTDGFSADLNLLRREYPIGWKSLKTWAEDRDWSILLEP